MVKRKYVCITADSEHCFDLSGFISAVGMHDINSRQYMPENNFLFFLWFATIPVTRT